VRRGPTARIQGTSQQNTWMRQATDPDWVYGYDAWTAPLDAAQEPLEMHKEA
jgi:6-hydroxynicotinate 3-monooxygenase